MRNILSISLVLILALVTLAWLVPGQHIYEPLTPDPEDVVKEFVGELSADRYEPAYRELADTVKSKLQIRDLEELDHKLHEKYGDYDFDFGGQLQREGDRATYVAQIKTERRGTQLFRFELERDFKTGLWEISSLESLQSAIQP